MRYVMRLGGLTLLFAILFGVDSVYAASTDANKDKEYLFVLSGMSGKVEGDTLTLNNVPSVVYFTDRPDRKTGHIKLQDFLAGWKAQEDSLNNNPPNAVLSVLDGEGNQNTVVVLQSPTVEGNDISFKIKTLEGTAPKKFKAASLFIDPINRAGPWTGT